VSLVFVQLYNIFKVELQQNHSDCFVIYWETSILTVRWQTEFLYYFFFTLDAGLLAKVSIRKVLPPTTSTQVILSFPVPKSKC